MVEVVDGASVRAESEGLRIPDIPAHIVRKTPSSFYCDQFRYAPSTVLA